jgi:hypothetical protein
VSDSPTVPVLDAEDRAGILAGAVRRWPLLLCGAFALLAAVETARALVAPLRAPRDAEWDSAAAEVRAGYQPGDLIVFAPGWVDPVGRHHLGDLVTPEMAARADASRYGRIWEVAIRGAHAAETRAPDASLVDSHAHGRVRVALYRKSPPVPVLYDFTAQLAEARVTQLAAGGRGDETPCLLQGNATSFRCAGTLVERRILEVDYAPHFGVLAPVDRGHVTRITFPDVPLGAALVGYTGLHDYYSRKNGAGPVEFSLFIDGNPVLELLHRNEDGWHRFSVDTTRYRGGRHSVRFEIESAQPEWRTFGFASLSVDEVHP